LADAKRPITAAISSIHLLPRLRKCGTNLHSQQFSTMRFFNTCT